MYRVILPPSLRYASTQDDQIGMARYIKHRIKQGTSRITTIWSVVVYHKSPICGEINSQNQEFFIAASA